MAALLGMIISQLLDPITLIITVITGAVWWRPPMLYVALVLGVAAKLALLLMVFSTAALHSPPLLLAAAIAGVIGIAVGAGLRWLVNRTQTPR